MDMALDDFTSNVAITVVTLGVVLILIGDDK